MSQDKINIAYVDDHLMVRQLMLRYLLESGLFHCVADASKGAHFIDLIRLSTIKPDVCLIDINLADSMNGFDVAAIIKKEFSDTKILAITSQDSEFSVIRMLQSGATGYILKGDNFEVLKEAIVGIHENGYYSTEIASSRLIHHHENDKSKLMMKVTDKELSFLKLNCSELTYKEIADIMDVGVRAVEYYRNSLYEKIGIKSRVDLAIFAMKNSLV